MSKKLLRNFVKEELGRNLRTVNTDPYTFRDMGDYNVEITPHKDGKFYMTIWIGDKKLTPTSQFSSYEDAEHTSRMVIDQDRVTRMNS